MIPLWARYCYCTFGKGTLLWLFCLRNDYLRNTVGQDQEL